MFILSQAPPKLSSTWSSSGPIMRRSPRAASISANTRPCCGSDCFESQRAANTAALMSRASGSTQTSLATGLASPPKLRTDPRNEGQEAGRKRHYGDKAPVAVHGCPPEDGNDDRGNREEEQPPHDEQMGWPRGVHPNSSDPRDLAAERYEIRRYEYERQGYDGQRGRRDSLDQPDRVIRASRVCPDSCHSNQERRKDRKVPHIVEGQGAEDESHCGRRRGAAAQGSQRGAPIPGEGRPREGPCLMWRSQVRPEHRQERDDERDRHDVWVEVAQDEAEEGELVDGVVERGVTVEEPYGPGRAPPPQVFLGPPRLGEGRQGFVEAVDAEPLPEPGGAEAVRSHELQHAFQVGRQHQHRRRGKARRKRVPQPLRVGADHARHKGKNTHCGQGGDEGERQVVRNGRMNAGQLGERPHHPVAEVVVADRFAPQPRVLRLAQVGVDRGVQESEVHRLLGSGDRGVVGAVQRPGGEDEQEQRLGGQQGPALLLYEG